MCCVYEVKMVGEGAGDIEWGLRVKGTGRIGMKKCFRVLGAPWSGLI